MDPRDPNPNDRIRRLDPNAPRRPRPNQSSKAGPSRSGGRGSPPDPARTPTSSLRPLPDPSPAQDGAFPIRLDPNSPPGEFNFLVPQAPAPVPANVGLIAEADGPIPPQLHKAVDEVLGFIYGLDQQFENQGRRPKK